MVKVVGERVDVSSLRYANEVWDVRDFLFYTRHMIDIINQNTKETVDDTIYEVFKNVIVPIEYPLPKWVWKLPTSFIQLFVLLMDVHMLFRHPAKPMFSLVYPDFWKLPYETLRDGVGDCEDTSILFGAFLHAIKDMLDKNLQYFVCVGVVRDKYTNEVYGHAWVEVNHKGYGWVLYETTLDKVPSKLSQYVILADEIQNRYTYEAVVKFNDERVEIATPPMPPEAKKRKHLYVKKVREYARKIMKHIIKMR